MRSTNRIAGRFGLAAIALLASAAGVAGQGAGHAHIGHVGDGFGNTPDGQGLLPTAIAEAQVAATHAGLLARDPSNLDAMKRHAGHVLHALDPSVVAEGPGAGYGVKRAAAGTAQHIELAAETEGASRALTTHAPHIATAARSADARADEAIALAQQIQAATTAEEAAPLATRLAELTQGIADGLDVNGDGTIGWQAPEGGLAQANQHLGLLKSAEGLSR